MEPAKSPLKGRAIPRPAYKALWQEAEQSLVALRAMLRDTDAKATHYQHQLAARETEFVAVDSARFRWMSAAVIEGLALVVAVILLLAR